MLIFKSKSQLDREKKTFAPLLADDYELLITNVEPKTQAKYGAVPDETGKVEMENVLNFTLEVVAFKDGDPVMDAQGNPAKGRKIFFTGRPDSMGFMKDGTPSKLRSLVAYATGQNVNDDISLGSWTDLVGKTVFAEIIDHTTKQGVKRNKIARFLPKRKRSNTQIPIIEATPNGQYVKHYDDGQEDIKVSEIPF